jgi:hypothetical protein
VARCGRPTADRVSAPNSTRRPIAHRRPRLRRVLRTHRSLIDVELHGLPHWTGSTHDNRLILPGGFSVEPGIYLKGRFGVRSEVNVVLHDSGPEVTPRQVQSDLIVA